MIRIIFPILFVLFSSVTYSQSLFKDLSAVQSGDSIFIRWTLIAGNTCFDMRVERANVDLIFDPIYQVPGLCGATSDLFYTIYDHQELESGSLYQYRITGSNGIYTSDTFFTNFYSAGQTEFILFPNPVDQSFSILLNSKLKPPYQLEIVNTKGEVFFTNLFFNQQQLINISNIPSGIYFCKIYADNLFVASKKIIKD